MLTPVLLCLLFSLAPILLLNSSNALSFDYPNFDGQNTVAGHCPKDVATICLDGNASVNNSVIFLTQDRVWQSGKAYYSEPVRLRDDSTGTLLLTSFTTNFSFHIARTDPTNSGDGLAFFLLSYPLPNITRSGGGRLGLASFHSSVTGGFVAVEIDTHKNEWDEPVPHVGIDENSMESAKCQTMQEYDSATTIECKAFVKYSSSNKELSVSLMCDPDREYTLSHAVDLSSIFTEKNVTIGFTGSTGGSTQTNQVSSWSFDSTLDGILEEARRKAQDSKKAMVQKFIAIGLAVAVALAIIVFVLVRRPWSRSPVIDGSDLDLSFARRGGPHRFSFHEILAGTCNFDEGKKLGVGGSGIVYRAFLQDLDREVAIKRVSNKGDLKLSKKEYIAEVKVISQLRHRHLVQLLGWCHEKGQYLIVYELMPNLSLDVHLFHNYDKSLLPWNVRYNMSLQIASALLYLHEDFSECIVHRDIKAKNIMLDGSFNAKLGDFGLARLTTHGHIMQTATFCGTRGYLAPECFQTCKATTQSDVYAFGIVLLEIATGRMVVESGPDGEVTNLVESVWRLYERGAIVEAADAKLGDDFERRQMERLLVVGLWCANPDPRSRPSIRKAMAALNFEDVKISIPLQMPNYGLQPSPIDFSWNSNSSNLTSGTPELEPSTSAVLAIDDPNSAGR